MLLPVVLSGGGGSRLWPVSRAGHPKPFMKLADGETLLEKTYRRARMFSDEVITVTNRDYYFMSRDELDRVGSRGPFLLEPFGRNTAPAVAIAAEFVHQVYGPGNVLLVLPADHLIQAPKAFQSAVDAAVDGALEDRLVTFGIVPTGPETGFGYIERAAAGEEITDVLRFIEKPTRDVAERFVASGRYLWNSGMFCFKAGTFLEELRQYSADIASNATACVTAMLDKAKGGVYEISGEIFQNAPDISVDYAVMEKSDRVSVVPGNFGWSDIGSWNAIRDLVTPDTEGNRAVGDVIFVDSHNTFIRSEDRFVAALGLDDLMIIDTSDALLVAHPDKTQEVKQVVAELKKRDHDTFRLHKTVIRPWGTYTVLEDAPGFKIKRIEVKPGASLSLQLHAHRSEHWVVVSGCAKVVNGSEVILINQNESTYIPAGQKHRLENPGSEVCLLIEVQCGPYLGEDDIVRFEDNYGRI